VKTLLKSKVGILMVTYNGLSWLSEQVNAILNQVDVDLTIFVRANFWGAKSYRSDGDSLFNAPKILSFGVLAFRFERRCQ
jgi:hypothetical protein